MKQELSYDDRKQWARLLYTQHDKSNKEISLTVTVDEATIRNWAAEGGWDALKQSMLISKTTQLEHYYSQLGKINQKLKDNEDANPKDIDLMVKYTTAIKNLEIEVPISTIIEVSELFIQWLRRKDISLTRKLIVHFDAFVKERIVS